jgi:hypothetical protein
MKLAKKLSEVEEAMDFPKPGVGGYIAKIIKVTDNVNREYLDIEWDFAEGEFEGYYAELYERFGNWSGRLIRSYKETALSFFKQFVTAVENSNPNFKFDETDEQKLVGKLVGVVLGEEEYENDKGETKIALKVKQIRSADKIRSGDFKIPEQTKRETKSLEIAPVSDDEVPF